MADKFDLYTSPLEQNSIAQLSINCAIFGYQNKKLQVIINEISSEGNTISLLPGGYVRQNEDVSLAVDRIIYETTGLTNILHKQFAVSGKASRLLLNEIPELRSIIQNLEPALKDWLNRRFVSICYLALVDYNNIELGPTLFPGTATWLPTDQADLLAMDHTEILKNAMDTLLKELPYTPIASHLLPDTFTLPELQSLVEAILGRKIDRPNFRRKILRTGMLVKVGYDTSGKRRPAILYEFKNGKNTSLINEFNFGF